MSLSKQEILQKYGTSPQALIRKGMEAEVYALDENTFLKLYVGTIDPVYLVTLRDFYNSLDRSVLSYALPEIKSIDVEGDVCITVERKLPGAPMSVLLSTYCKKQMDDAMRAVLAAVLELNRFSLPLHQDRYKLFDGEGLSLRSEGDWHQFLARFLRRKLIELESHLEREVMDFHGKSECLFSILEVPYIGDYRLVHGDFFPGNILVDGNFRITALLDFGLLTMYGDPLFDIATGWVFFDMYDVLKVNIRERYLSIILEMLGERVRGILYRYVLLYSFLSANTYSPACSDDHYQWCVANLNDQEYWNKIE